MKIFPWSKTKKRASTPRKKKTLKDFSDKAVLEHIKENPKAALEYGLRNQGLESMIPTPPDPIKQKKEELKVKALEAGFERISGDEDALAALSQALLAKELGLNHGNGKNYEDDEDPLDRLFDQLDKMDKFRDRIGGNSGGGMLGGLIDSDVVRVALEQIVGPILLNRSGAQQTGGVTPIIVDTPQGLVQMSPQEFEQYQRQRQLATPQSVQQEPEPAPVIIPEPVPPPPPRPSVHERLAQEMKQEAEYADLGVDESVKADTIEETPISDPNTIKNDHVSMPGEGSSYTISTDVENETQSIGLRHWIGHVGEDVVAFVAYLLELQMEGEMTAEKCVSVLNNCANAEEFIAMIQPFKDLPEYEVIVYAIEDNIEWLDEIIEYVKNMMEV